MDQDKYSAAAIRLLVISKNLTWLDHHRCGIRNVMVGYALSSDYVAFSPGCGCAWEPP
jgi:hypothetical protein